MAAGLAVMLAANLKFVEVVVFPAHRRLDGPMQLLERDASIQDETTPDRRLDFQQGNFQLI